MKEYRFFFHYNKQAKKMTVHFQGACYIAKNILVYPACQTHYNKRQPYLTMRGFATGLVISKDADTIVVQNMNDGYKKLQGRRRTV